MHADNLAHIERIRFAVLELSDGDLDQLQQAIELAQIPAMHWRRRSCWMCAGVGLRIVGRWAWLTILRRSGSV